MPILVRVDDIRSWLWQVTVRCRLVVLDAIGLTGKEKGGTSRANSVTGGS